MKINKQKFICILAEEINSTLLKEQLSPEDTKKIVDRFMKKLDSIDMSLDLIYTSLVGTGYSLAGVRAKQKGLGRAMVGQPAGEVNEAKERIWRVIDEEVDYVLNKRLISEQEDELAGEHDLELVRKRMDQFDDEIDQAQQELNNATDTRSRAQAQKKLAALMKKKSDLSDKLSDLQLGTKGAAKAGRGAAVAQKGEKLRHKVGRAVFSLFGKAAMGNDWKKMDDEQIQQAYNSIFKRSDLSQAEYEKLHRAIEDKSAPVGEKIPLIKKIIGPEGMEAGKEAAEDAAEEIEAAPAASGKPEGEEDQGPSLKKLDKGVVRVALNQLGNLGFNAKKITASIEDGVKKIARSAGPQRQNFIDRDLPAINMIKDEVVKILSGDFSNLMKESKRDYIYVHPVTHAIIIELAKGEIISEM